MAKCEVVRQWPDEDILRVSVTVATSFPDAVREAEASCARLYKEALGLSQMADELPETGDE